VQVTFRHLPGHAHRSCISAVAVHCRKCELRPKASGPAADIHIAATDFERGFTYGAQKMKRMIPVAFIGALLASPAFAGCALPSAPSAIPDGKTAGKDAMMAKKKEVDQYKKDVETYLSCESNTSKVESAQAELERVANRFNAEVRAFKAANADT
jgi:hypothetical protein